MINKSVSYHKDLIESLRDPIERAAYINSALEDGDLKVSLATVFDPRLARTLTPPCRKFS